jgi:uncharacterized membrane protein/YHS domain-containing protein
MKISNSTTPLLLPVIVMIAFSFAASTIQAGSVADGYCPVTTTEKVDSTIFVDYNGQRVYFCCNSCRKDFISDPQKYAFRLTARDSLEEPSSQSEEHDHETDTTSVHVASESASEGHDHATDHAKSGFSLILFLGKFHPVAIHFPIALVLTSLFLSILSLASKREDLERAGLLLIYLAAPAAIATSLLGLAAGSGATYPSFLKAYFLWHRALGLTSAGLTTLTAVFGWRWRKTKSPASKWVYRSLLLLNGIVIGITGHLGATLVFGPDHFSTQ